MTAKTTPLRDYNKLIGAITTLVAKAESLSKSGRNGAILDRK